MRRLAPGIVTVGASLALFFGALSGCDTGGLLVVTSNGSGGSPPVLGPNVTEIVNGGNVAGNAKYKVVYTLGQPTPNQGPMKGAKNRDNGGLVGAMNGP